MKCVLVVDRFPAETFVLRQAEALGAAVATGVIHHDTLRQAAFEGSVVSLTGNKRFNSGVAARLVQKARYRLLNNWIAGWSSDAERSWAGYLSGSRPDVVLAQFGPNALRCLPACRRFGTPVVAHFHGYDASELLRFPSYRRQLREAFPFFAGVVVVSQAMKHTLIEQGCPAENIHVIPCGVPLDRFPVASRQANQPCRFIFVGRFVEKKAPLLLIRAFEQCAGSVADAELVMIGNGPLYQRARRMAEKSGFAARIHLPGALSNTRVSEELQNAGCYVQHSRTAANGDQEGWPVAIAEAASCALPVIATRHAGIPEQVVDGVTGYLVDEGDWSAMGQRMIAVAHAPAWRLSAGLAGREHISATGRLEDCVSRLQAVVADAAEQSAGTEA